MKSWSHSFVNSPVFLTSLCKVIASQDMVVFFPCEIQFNFSKGSLFTGQLTWKLVTERQLSFLFTATVNLKKEIGETAFGSEGRYSGERSSNICQLRGCCALANTHVSMLSPSKTVCTGRQPIRGCFAKYLLVRNLFFSTLAKSRTSSPDVV